MSEAACAPGCLANVRGAQRCENLPKVTGPKSGTDPTSCPTPAQASRGGRGWAPPLPLERGVCAGAGSGVGCVCVCGGVGSKKIASCAKDPTCSRQLGDTRPAAPLSPAPQGNKSFVRLPSGLMQSRLLVKSGKQSRRKRGCGRGAAAVSSGQVGAQSRRLPSPPSRPGHLLQQTSPPAPRAGRSATGRVLVSRCPSPAPCPAAGLTSAKPPARERGKLAGAGTWTKRPSPQPLGTYAAAASRSLPSDSPGQAYGRPPDPKAPGKRLQQPRRAAAPHRAAPSSPGPRSCPPAASAPDSGAVALASHRAWFLARGPGLSSPHCRPESPGVKAHGSRLASARDPRKDRPLSPLFSLPPPIFTSL